MCCSAVCEAKPQTPNTAWVQSVFAETAAPIITSHWPQNAEEDIRICIERWHFGGLNKRFGLYLFVLENVCSWWLHHVTFKLCQKGSFFLSQRLLQKFTCASHSLPGEQKNDFTCKAQCHVKQSPCPWRKLPFLASLWVAGKRQIMGPDNENSFKLKVWTLMR